MATEPPRCGTAALVGRPNTGKSTLLNRLVGVRLAAVTHRPQTTRNVIAGIFFRDNVQTIMIDTPGIHLDQKRLINKVLNRNAAARLHDVDVIVFLVENGRWDREEDHILSLIKETGRPCILCINKIDLGRDKKSLLPFIARLSERYSFDEIIPLSAKTGDNVPALEQSIARRLPGAPHRFPEDQLTDRSERFIAAELIREQCILHLREEVAYSVLVEIDEYKETGERVNISATLWVERASHKLIVVGSGGRMLKAIGSRARRNIAHFLDKKVMLRLWVKIKENWQDDPQVVGSIDTDY